VIAIELAPYPLIEPGSVLAKLLRRARLATLEAPPRLPDQGRAALAAIAAGQVPDERYYLQVTPVNLRADGLSLRLMKCDFTLDDAELAAFFAVIEPLFLSDGWSLQRGANGALFAAHPTAFDFVGAAPEQALGADVHAFLPLGQPLRALRRLLSEAEIALQATATPINGIWLSGGGKFVDVAHCPYQALFSDDPLAFAWARGASCLSIRTANLLPLALREPSAWIDLRAVRDLQTFDALLFAPLQSALRWRRSSAAWFLRAGEADLQLDFCASWKRLK